MLGLDSVEKTKPNEQESIFLNSTLTTPKTINEKTTKAYVQSLHDENDKPQRDLGLKFYDETSDSVKINQGHDFNDNKLTNLDSLSVNRKRNLKAEVSNKNFVDDELDKNTILIFNQTLQKY